MTTHSAHTLLSALNYLTLLLMLAAILYSGWIALTYWTGIGV